MEQPVGRDVPKDIEAGEMWEVRMVESATGVLIGSLACCSEASVWSAEAMILRGLDLTKNYTEVCPVPPFGTPNDHSF